MIPLGTVRWGSKAEACSDICEYLSWRWVRVDHESTCTPYSSDHFSQQKHPLSSAFNLSLLLIAWLKWYSKHWVSCTSTYEALPDLMVLARITRQGSLSREKFNIWVWIMEAVQCPRIITIALHWVTKQFPRWVGKPSCDYDSTPLTLRVPPTAIHP